MHNFAKTLLVNLMREVYLPALLLAGLAVLPLVLVAVAVYWYRRAGR